jgi:hypothetical protein
MRQIMGLMAVVLLALVSYSGTASAMQGIAPGRYQIEMVASGKVLDLNAADKRSVQQWSKANVVNQQWDIERASGDFYHIRSAETGDYLAIDGAGNGAKISVANRGNRASHLWRIEDSGNGQVRIIHRSGLSLDLPNGAAEDGVRMQVWSPAQQNNQLFRLLPVSMVGSPVYNNTPSQAPVTASGPGFSGPGVYEIESAMTGKVLDLRREDYRTVQQWARGGVRNQQWNFESAGGDYYYIRSAENGAYMGVEGAGNGARVVATTTRGNNRNNQVWRVVDADNGLVTLVHRSGQVLDLHKDATKDGQAMQVWSSSGQANQMFKLVRVGNVDTDVNTSPTTGGTVSRAYEQGYQAGTSDQRAALPRNYRRYRDRYNASTETDFHTGYDAGYDRGRDDNTRDNNTGGTRAAYNEGYQAGASDNRAALNRNHRRHRNRYDRNSEADFQAGYNAGYDGARNDGIDDDDDLSRMTANERRTYDEGYRYGQDDARGGYNANYRRYSNRYNRSQETFFQRGYEAGYNSIRR